MTLDLSAKAWEDRYLTSDTPWDLSTPTPEFLLLLEEKKIFKKEVLIPGAGRGHDAIALAKAGCVVSTVDFSPTATENLLIAANKEKVNVICFQEDFFALASQAYHQERYDILLEYTFFCAIDPALREKYVVASANVLKKGGSLIGLFFPTDERVGGPPFAVSRKEVESLFAPYFDLEISEPRRSVKPRAGKEFLGFFRKK